MFDLDRLKEAIESPISTVTVEELNLMVKNNMNKLLPCPFCGSDLNNQDPLDTVYPSDRQMTLWQVVCNNCSATMLGESRENVIYHWNYRV